MQWRDGDLHCMHIGDLISCGDDGGGGASITQEKEQSWMSTLFLRNDKKA